jgi:hypothetical protein
MAEPERRRGRSPRGTRSALPRSLVFVASIHALITVSPAQAQIPIGLYTDGSGSVWRFTGNAPGPFSAYVVVHPEPNGVLGVHFSADESCGCGGNSAPYPPMDPSPPDNAPGENVRTGLTWDVYDYDTG